MCSCSNTSAFAWAGFVIINGALIGLIGLLGGSSWVAAFVLTLLYALALLAAAFFLERRIGTTDDGSDGDEDDAALKGVVAVIYVLFVAALGTSGSILTANLFICGWSGGNFGGGGGGSGGTFLEWVPLEGVPADILPLKSSSPTYPEYAYFSSSATTWFASPKSEGGGEFSQNSFVHATSGGAPPAPVALPVDDDPTAGLKDPYRFVAVSGGGACLVANGQNIYCSSAGAGSDVRMANVPPPGVTRVRNMKVSSDGGAVLWFAGNADSGTYGVIYYSVDVATMETTLWSKLSQTTNGDDDADETDDTDCRSPRSIRKSAAAVLLLVIFPIAASSFALYVGRDVPSMPLPLYLAATAGVVVSYVLVDTEATHVEGVLQWWLTGAGAALLAVLAYLSLTGRIAPAAMGWGSFTASVSYTIGICWVVRIFTGWDDEWRWILINAICILPLVGAGLMLGEVFLINLGAIGLIFDAVYISTKIPSNQIITRFLFLALFGVLIIVLGVFLQKQSKSIREKVDRWAAANLGRRRQSPARLNHFQQPTYASIPTTSGDGAE